MHVKHVSSATFFIIYTYIVYVTRGPQITPSHTTLFLPLSTTLYLA